MSWHSFLLPNLNLWRAGAIGMDVVAAGRGTPADIDVRRRSRLDSLLQSAIERSTLYRRLAGRPQRTLPDLADMPVVTKAQLMHDFGEWTTDRRVSLETVRRHIKDPALIGQPVFGDLIAWESSGSSGVPGVFLQDAQALAVYDALETLRRPKLRPMDRMLDPWYMAERLAFVGATGGHFATTVSIERLRQINPWMGATLRSFSFLLPTDELVDRLNDHSPTIIATYPTAAVLLAEQARDGRLRIEPKEVWTGGETLTPAMRRTVEEAFGCRVANAYGASEFLAMASECPQHRLHLNADWVILEPVDAQHRPVPPGTPGSTTLLTNLANHTQPIIRYDLGDRIMFHERPCSCGLPLPVFEVEGRTDDALVLADRRGRDVRLVPLALTTVMEDDAHVHDFQIEQRSTDALLLRVGAADADSCGRAGDTLRGYLARMGLPDVHVNVRREQGVRGKSGKLSRVIALQPHSATRLSARRHHVAGSPSVPQRG